MPAKSTETRYGSVAILIHWTSALLILAALAAGFRAAATPDPAAKAQFLSVHIPLAVVVVVLTIGRLLWWWFADRKPAPAGNMPRWQERGAKAVHWLFYIVILGMGASGAGMLIISGAGPIILGGAEGQLPDFWEYRPRIPHGLGARFMLLLLVMHIGAALFHQFVKRDGLLLRMWFGKREP